MRSSVFPSRESRRHRGGVLITALIFSAIIAVALPSFLLLSRSALKLSHRGFYNTAAVDLAETGLEQAMWSLNAASQGTSGAWSGWDTTSSPGNARRRFANFTYTGGATGYVNVHVTGYGAPGASAVARAVIAISPKETVEKWMRITTKGRSLFPYGLLARDSITAAGGAMFDSWISDPTGTGSPIVPWSSAVSRDKVTIATVSTAVEAVKLRPSAVVYGKVGVGRAAASNVTYGQQTASGMNSVSGIYQDWGTKVGPKGMPTASYPYLHPGHLVSNFTATFETYTAPTTVTPTVGSTYVLPRSVSGPPYYLSTETIGADNTTTVLQYNKLTVEGAATLTIKGNVVLILPQSGVETLRITASGKMQLATGATLSIYTPGNIDVSGAGIVNPASPKSLQIWSTRAANSLGQTIQLAGSGNLSGIIYAPYATFSLPGGTHFYGAAVVHSAALTGSGQMHYDESLLNFGSGSAAVGIGSYAELDSDAKRSTYATQLAF